MRSGIWNSLLVNMEGTRKRQLFDISNLSNCTRWVDIYTLDIFYTISDGESHIQQPFTMVRGRYKQFMSHILTSIINIFCSYEQQTDTESDDDRSFATLNNVIPKQTLDGNRENILPSPSSGHLTSQTMDKEQPQQGPSTSHIIATPLISRNRNCQSTPLQSEPSGPSTSEPCNAASGLTLSQLSTSGPSTSTANESSANEAVSNVTKFYCKLEHLPQTLANCRG